MDNKIIDPIDQIENVRNAFKEFKTALEDDKIDADVPQTLYFFNSKTEAPLAFINMPPFKSEEKRDVFHLAFGSLKYIQTDRMVMTSDVWFNKFLDDKEMDEWYEEGKSLSEHPKSEQALMTSIYTKDGDIYSVIDVYGLDDEGNFYFKKDQDYKHEDWKNSHGLIPHIVSKAYTNLYDENYVTNSKNANQYFGMISSMGFDINMSDMLFHSLGLEDAELTDEWF